MVVTKKLRKSLESVSSRLRLVTKNGMYVLGYKQALEMIRQGKASLVILSSRCPALRTSDRYCLCWLKPVSITAVAIRLNWAQRVETTTDMHTGCHGCRGFWYYHKHAKRAGEKWTRTLSFNKALPERLLKKISENFIKILHLRQNIECFSSKH